MKNDLEQLQHQTEDKDSKYKEEISLWKNKIEESQQKSESMKEELHQIKAQHDELVAALRDLGVKVIFENIWNFPRPFTRGSLEKNCNLLLKF